MVCYAPLVHNGKLPSRRSALKALHNGAEVWVTLSVVKKRYFFCRVCAGAIGVGDDAFLAHYRERRPGGSEHHFSHPSCFRERLLPLLGEVRRIPPREAELGTVNKCLRRRRGNASRRARGTRRR
jgi:hypothetical protein